MPFFFGFVEEFLDYKAIVELQLGMIKASSTASLAFLSFIVRPSHSVKSISTYFLVQPFSSLHHFVLFGNIYVPF